MTCVLHSWWSRLWSGLVWFLFFSPLAFLRYTGPDLTVYTQHSGLAASVCEEAFVQMCDEDRLIYMYEIQICKGVYCTVMFLLDAHMCVLVPCVSVWVRVLGFM